MRNPFRTEYSGSAREKYMKQGSQAAHDKDIQREVAAQLREEKTQKQRKAKLGGAESKVRKCSKSKVKPGGMKCGALGSGVYCNKHTREGTIITNGGR